MSSYLVIQNNTNKKSYQYKSTYTGNPYIQVNRTGYLDLTTKTTTGIQLKYRQEQKSTKTITYNQQSTGVSTTGYSGQAVFQQTTGYSGVSTETHLITTITATSYNGTSVWYQSAKAKTGTYTVTHSYNSSSLESSKTYTASRTTTLTGANYNYTNSSFTSITTPIYYIKQQTNVASALVTSTEVGNLVSTTALISTSIGNTTSNQVNNSISIPLTETITYINNITETVPQNVSTTIFEEVTTSITGYSGTFIESSTSLISSYNTITSTITTTETVTNIGNEVTQYAGSKMTYLHYTNLGNKTSASETIKSTTSKSSITSSSTLSRTDTTTKTVVATSMIYTYITMITEPLGYSTNTEIRTETNIITTASTSILSTTLSTLTVITSSNTSNISNNSISIPLTTTSKTTNRGTTTIQKELGITYRPLEIITKSSSVSSQITVTTMYSGKSTYYRTTTYYNVNSRTTSATYRTYSGYKGYRYNNDINPSIFYVTNNATSNAYNNSSYSVTQANSANGTTYQFRTTYMTSINNLQSSYVQTGLSTYLGNSYTQLRSTSSYATSTAIGNLLSTTAFTTISSGSTSQSYSTEI